MKRVLSVFCSIILVLLLLGGCATPDSLLSSGETDFINDLADFEADYGGDVPKSVLDTLDFMLENYTNGISQPNIKDIKNHELKDDDKDKVGKKASEDATNHDEVKDVILKALSETQQSVALRIEKSIFSSELLYEVIFDEIGGNYIVESLGVNSYSYSYYEDVTTNKYVVEITFNYFALDHYDHGFTLEQIRQMKQELKTEAEKVVQRLGLDSLSEYEKVKAINQYLCDNITYSSGDSPYLPIQHTPYGALVNGDCVCEGYAKAAQLLLKMCGMETYYVVGDTPEGGHGWNLVKVDGEYYQLDITWNDVDSSPNQYFLVTDDYMSLSRTWDRTKYPQSAKKPYT